MQKLKKMTMGHGTKNPGQVTQEEVGGRGEWTKEKTEPRPRGEEKQNLENHRCGPKTASLEANKLIGKNVRKCPRTMEPRIRAK